MTSDDADGGPPPPPGRQPWQEGRPPEGAQQSPGAQQPPGAQPPASQPSGGPYQPMPSSGGRGGPVGAGLGARIGARLLDVLIVAIPLSIVLSLVGWGAGAVLSPGGTEGQITAFVQSLLWFGYFVWLESTRGATIGKSIVNIHVVGPNGTPPTTEEAMKRNAWMLLGLIPWVGGLLGFAAIIVIMVTIASGSDMQGLHDQWANTAVLRR